jgi:putative GTP pyrophosphokinase
MQKKIAEKETLVPYHPSMLDRNTKNILDQFEAKKGIYHDYSLVVKNLLEGLLLKQKYKYQLSHRIKDRNSLREKIERKKRIGKFYKHLDNVEDIVGIRVVFYTEADRRHFIKVLNRVFKNDLKVEETSKASGYRSTHAILVFGKERTALSEYRQFKALKCEIQLTLILNHAWAEVEHDILYKDGITTAQIDSRSYCDIKSRMEKVMHNYIRKASAELEEIVKKIKKLRSQKRAPKIDQNKITPNLEAYKVLSVANIDLKKLSPSQNL